MDYIGRALVADALREWREQLQDRATVSPLRDLAATQASLIDLRAGHPSGLAQLFANRPTAISSLLRDSQAREGGLHRARLIIDEAERVRAATGAWTPALVIGTVAFRVAGGRVEMPLLMRAVGLDRYRADDVQVTLRDEVFLNPVFLAVVRERAVAAGTELTLPQITAGRDFDPRPLWEAVRGLTHLLGDDLEVLDRLLLGVFDDPEQRLLDDLDDCDPVIAASTVLAAAAGDKDAVALLNEPLPAFPRGDRDPFAERGVGDLDDVQFAVLDLIATGRDVFLQAPPGADAVGMAAAVAADGAASGKTVGVVGGADRTLAAITDRLRLLGAPDLVIDATVPQWNAEARARLLESITMGTPQVDDAALRSSGETLLRTRAELHRRFDALHRSHRPWGVSVFEAVQSIVRLTTSEPAPGTTMRLSRDAGAVVAEHGFASVAHAISAVLRPSSDSDPAPEPDAVEPEAPAGDPWWKDAVEPEQGARLDEALSTLLGRVVPKLRAEAAIAAHETGVDEADSMDTWVDQVGMFERLREILEVFSPAVFHRSLHDLVAATAPHGSPRHVDIPRRERRALMRRAVELLRPGRGKESLHADLVRAHELALQWRHHCSAGGWPTVPDDYDIFSDRVTEAVALWSTLRETAESALDEQDVASLPWDEMVGLLDRLGQGLPGTLEVSSTEPLGIDVEAAGFGPLVEDLRERDAGDAQVRRDLEFAWWAAAFDAIVSSDAALTEYGALGEAVERFRTADATFAASRIGPLMRAAAERRRTAIARHPDLARDLFAALVEGGEASIKELWRDFGPLTAALRPIVIAKAEQVSRLAPPTRAFDVAVVVASESLALAELVPVLARAKQVVVLGDAHAATRSAIAALAAMLPRVVLHAMPQPRDVRVTAVLSGAAYGRSLEALPAAADRSGAFEVREVDGVGAPVAGADAVESTRAEVAAVVEHAAQSHGSLPRHSLMIVAGNDLHAARLREALRERSTRLAAMIPVAVLGDVAGPVVDEVVLSLGFARDARGAAPHALGALSEPWGREALVQALVATRERLTVFSAVGASQLPSDGVDGAGVEDLRELLLASTDQAIAPERPEPAPSDWLLSDVAQRLRLAGYAVHVRYGNGPDAVPMVVGGKRDRGYRVAVVTDEAAPAGSASLRDRMRWQRASLEALGWRVVALWTLDVFMDPDAAAEQVRAALEDAEPQVVQDSLEIDIPGAGVPADSGEHPAVAPEATAVAEEAPAEPAPVEVPGMLELDGPEDDAEREDDAADRDADEVGSTGGESDEDGAQDEADDPEAESGSAFTGDGEHEDVAEPQDDAEPKDDGEAQDDGETQGDGEHEADAASEPSPDPAPERPAAPARAPRPVDRSRGADRPLIPTRASEDVDEGWGGRDQDDRAEELKRERPPHW